MIQISNKKVTRQVFFGTPLVLSGYNGLVTSVITMKDVYDRIPVKQADGTVKVKLVFGITNLVNFVPAGDSQGNYLDQWIITDVYVPDKTPIPPKSFAMRNIWSPLLLIAVLSLFAWGF